MTEQELTRLEDLLTRAVQSGKQETSDLVLDIKDNHKLILAKVEAIDSHLKTLNGSVAKHADKLANHDIINAQTTLSLSTISENLKSIQALSLDNNTFKNKAEGSLNTFKWLFGFLGVGNVAIFLKVVLQLW